MKNRFFTNVIFFAIVLVLGLAFGACDGIKNGSLEKLQLGATRAEVLEKMDAILTSEESPNEAKVRVRELKQKMEYDISDNYWSIHGNIFVKEINEIILIKQPIWVIISKNKDFIIPLLSLISITISLTAIFISIANFFQKNIDYKNEMYQRLEFASIECFKWESENKKELVEIRDKFKKNWINENSKDGETPREIRMRISQTILPEELILLETWCSMELNLFELIITNTLDDTARGDVFVTWLPWIFEAAHESGFKQIWQGRLFAHYLGNCKNVIDCALKNTLKESFIEEVSAKYKKLKIDKKEIIDWIKL